MNFNNSARVDEFKRLEQRFEKFADIETITKLEETYLPKMASFTDLVNKLEASHKTMRECIRKFDEDIAEKANKSALTLCREDLERRFIELERYNKLVSRDNAIEKELRETHTKMEAWFEDLKIQNRSMVKNLVDGELEVKLRAYEQVVTAFKQFFDQEELAALLDRKADIEFVSHLQEKKAEQRDVRAVDAFCKQLYLRLKHLSVLQAELA